MAIRNPTILAPGNAPPTGAVKGTEWFERQVGEFKVQYQLPCFHDEATDTYFVESGPWDTWEIDLVRYFISQGYSSPEIDAFIQTHALSGQ